MIEDFETCYRAVQARDARFDGCFFTAVTSTHIFCRPSCPARTPSRANVRFHRSAAAAIAAGFRACRRCRPDVTPGSPEWNSRADLVARAMRGIADGVIDRGGVAALAATLNVGERHLHRVLMTGVGAGPLALARAQRAATARILIETTRLSFVDVAFAAGFSSLRQFNDSIRSTFDATPSQLRLRPRGVPATPGTIALNLPVRRPAHITGVLDFLGARAVAGVEEYADGVYRRALRLPHGHAVVELSDAGAHVRCTLRLERLTDLCAAVSRCRRLLDLDADPVAVDAQLGGDMLLAPAVRTSPGRRVPGTVDGVEVAVRAVAGQQVSVAGARTVVTRLVAAAGERLHIADTTLTHVFPGSGSLLGADPAAFAMPAARRAALRGLLAAIAGGRVHIDPTADREEERAALLALPGIGPWTASYIAMRALGDPDAFLATDLGVRRGLEQLGHHGDVSTIAAAAERWRPWRAYAMQYIWNAVPATARTT